MLVCGLAEAKHVFLVYFADITFCLFFQRLQVPHPCWTSSPLTQPVSFVWRVRNRERGAGQSWRHVAEATGARRGQRDAERDEKWRGWGERLKPDRNVGHWEDQEGTTATKIRLQTPSSPRFSGRAGPRPQHRRRGGLVKGAKGAGKAERWGGGKDDGLRLVLLWWPQKRLFV